MPVWNPWHGCHRISAGCLHCYMYRRDAEFDKDSGVVNKTADFDLPLRRKRDGSPKLTNEGRVYSCMTSDFFIEEADEWRRDAWRMIGNRPDLHFVIITKRIHRFYVSLPDDWDRGYENVTVCATCENQKEALFRLPLLLDAPLAHREIICEPLLEEVDIGRFLSSGMIEKVTLGGESGPDARPLDYDWVKSVRAQCERTHTDFYFKQTGARFVKDGKTYMIDRKNQLAQARKAGIDLYF
ncbi:MAG: DUF5131 family protein [Clostridia bacterium]|nr:DUF5131 family protein [Clostridia bacterium]